MPDPIVWWELATQDEERSVEFFRRVFGWPLEYDERLGFHVMAGEVGDEINKISGGGIFTLRKPKLPFVALYIRVTGIEEKAGQIEEYGGLIVEAPHAISERAKICLFNDPSGVTWAMIESIAN
jgi:predicted enzyme related to lactoylglutathione lyase